MEPRRQHPCCELWRWKGDALEREFKGQLGVCKRREQLMQFCGLSPSRPRMSKKKSVQSKLALPASTIEIYRRAYTYDLADS